MESQNYLTIAIEKMGHVMLDDRHMKASDIYKTAVKLHKKEDYNPPSYNEDKFKVRSVFEKGGLCFYVMPKDGRATEFFMYIHGGGFVSRITHNDGSLCSTRWREPAMGRWFRYTRLRRSIR